MDPKILHVVKNLGNENPVAIILAETLNGLDVVHREEATFFVGSLLCLQVWSQIFCLGFPYLARYLSIFNSSRLLISSLNISLFFPFFLLFPLNTHALFFLPRIWLYEKLKLIHNPLIPFNWYQPQHYRGCKLKVKEMEPTALLELIKHLNFCEHLSKIIVHISLSSNPLLGLWSPPILLKIVFPSQWEVLPHSHTPKSRGLP